MFSLPLVSQFSLDPSLGHGYRPHPDGLMFHLLHPGGLRSRLLRPGGLQSRLLRPGGLQSRLLCPGGLQSCLLCPAPSWWSVVRFWRSSAPPWSSAAPSALLWWFSAPSWWSAVRLWWSSAPPWSSAALTALSWCWSVVWLWWSSAPPWWSSAWGEALSRIRSVAFWPIATRGRSPFSLTLTPHCLLHPAGLHFP